MDDCRLILGDCLEVLPTLEAGSIDLVCADPPYGTTACKWDTVIPLEPLWRELRRVLKPRRAVVLNACQPFTTTLIGSNRKWFKYAWVWLKSQPGDPMNAKNRPLRAHEDVCVFSEGTTANRSPRRMKYNPQELRPCRKQKGNWYRLAGDDSFKPRRPSHEPTYLSEFTNYPTTVLYFPQDRKAEGRVHPTQKPVALLEYLVRTYSDEGDTVLDFCMGSGTTGVACLRAGRKFVGIEKDADYFALARRRLAAFQGGPAHPDAREVEAEEYGPLFAGGRPA